MEIKAYKKTFEHSYALGIFPTVELIGSRPESLVKVLVSSSYRSDSELDIFDLCRKNNIKAEVNDKAINKISQKENCYVAGVFDKYQCHLSQGPHIVLVNPSNMGNMGTIIRTMLGFGLKDLAIISPGVDIFDPKVIRASMGAVFKINFKYYETFDEYYQAFKDHKLYPFMLDGAVSLKDVKHDKKESFSLIFGNEARGLDAGFSGIGTSVLIKHTDEIDSLNLTIAAGIAMYHFCG